jgi:uncharacterized protein involved in type VI secretion and phage assembly
MKCVTSVAIGVVKAVRPGEVLLELPWLQQSYRTDWVSMAMPLTGNQRGIFFMPEVGDEVVVGFDRGDLDHPIVLGALWNGVDKPTESEIQNRVIHTPGHHELRFEDKEGAKKVVLQTSAGHKVVMDEVADSITISDASAQNQVVIDIATQQITVKAAAKIVVEAPKIELAGGSSHPLVFGDDLLNYLAALVTQLTSHTHSGPVVLTPPTAAMLSTKVNTG